MAFNFSITKLERLPPGPTVAADTTRRDSSRGILRYRPPQELHHL